MKTICVLENTIQEYAWGSTTSIQELLGIQTDLNKPMAEVWMGAHPKAPSMVKCNGELKSLLKLIDNNPEDILGKITAEKFNKRLPYLFKVLAAAKPLSIQAHPNLKQAKDGFAKENRLCIALDAYNRNYKDDNHKPECICALTPFWALNGFRKISEIILLFEKISMRSLKDEIDILKKNPDSKGLKNFFHALLIMDKKKQNQTIKDAITNAKKLGDDNLSYIWMMKLYDEYPEDIGIFSPILLNLVCLQPGQAMFLPAGELHAYLDGTGMELMANSDNVLRGGLTPKHMDIQELLDVLNFKERIVKIYSPSDNKHSEYIYFSKAEEFVLSVLNVKPDRPYTNNKIYSVEILICTKGKASIIEPCTNKTIRISKGTSVIVPAIIDEYMIKGKAEIYVAKVPEQSGMLNSNSEDNGK